MSYDSVVIGHICMDTNIDHSGKVEHCAGGAVLYSSAVAHQLGYNTLAVTKLRVQDSDWLETFPLPRDDIVAVPAKVSTIMRNVYLTPDRERRLSVCSEQGDGFSVSDIPHTDAKVYQLAGLTVGDFSGELIVALSKRGKVAVDVQGFLRRVMPDRTMEFFDWDEKETYLPYVYYLKTDAKEAEVLTGLTDRAEAAKVLYGQGAREVIITHNTEVLVYDGNAIYTCPIRSRNTTGRTGRGDTTFAAYICERITKSVPDALLYATATVSLKMEKSGVFSGTRSDVDSYIREFYPEYSI